MKETNYTITDNDGIHARPAGMLVKEMQKFSSDIKISKGEKSADGKKLFALMSLAVKKGDTITLTAQGEDEEKAIEAAIEFLQNNL